MIDAAALASVTISMAEATRAMQRMQEAFGRALLPAMRRLVYAIDYAHFFWNLAPSADLLRLVETRWPA